MLCKSIRKPLTGAWTGAENQAPFSKFCVSVAVELGTQMS